MLTVLVIIAFNAFQQIERWLHQHIFKVGWLVTKNFETTTTLYYTFFLPGILIYEVIYWLAAGALNVRAERAISWPEKQEIGELRLNFVKLTKKASPWKILLINFAPFLGGMLVIWFIAINNFDMQAIFETMQTGRFADIRAGIDQLISTTDFWLWAYILFTVSNTMLPDAGIFKGWQWVLMVGVVVSIPFFFLGVGDQVIGGAITGPIAGGLEILFLLLMVSIVFDLVGVAILSIIENTIEYITGDSATFKNGKMIVMSREEAIALRKKEREASRRKQQRSRQIVAAASSGPPSIYKVEFPLPGPPGKEPVSTIPTSLIEPEAKPALTGRPKRDDPSVIPGDIKIGAPPPELAEDREADEPIGIRFGGALARSNQPDEDDADDEPAARETAKPNTFSRPATNFNRSVPAPVADEEDDDEEENAPATQRTGGMSGLRPRPSPFSNSPTDDADDSDDEDENTDNTPSNQRPGGMSGLRPRPSPFAKRQSDADDSADEDEEDNSTISRSGLRPHPSPFSRSQPDDDSADENEEEPDTRRSEGGISGLRPRPSPFARSESTATGGEDDRKSRLRGSLQKFGGVNPASKSSVEDDDSDDLDDDEIVYEDVDDSV